MIASIVIPVYNGAQTLGDCLASLVRQVGHSRDIEIIVVDDGSTDSIPDLVRGFSGVRLLRQSRQGPAAARNRGAREARGEIVLFTDSDCIPLENWLEQMLAPLRQTPDLIAVKGAYLTRQRSLTARFVQMEYEDKYDKLARQQYIDFIDTYSAAYRRQAFLAAGGFDEEFPLACAEDVELSYRLANQGCKMRFIPEARVIHRHPENLWHYLRKKFKFSYWRMLTVRKNPNKILADSHTPQTMKVQLLLAPMLVSALLSAPFFPGFAKLSFTAFILTLLTAVPFVIKALHKDAAVGLLAPFFLISRSAAQFLGVSLGLLNHWRLRGSIRSRG